MTTRRDFFKTVPAAGASLALAGGIGVTSARTQAQGPVQGPGWHSPSLVDETVTGPQGAVTTRTLLEADGRWGIGEKTAAEVAPGVWLLSGWGIAHSMAVKAVGGWIIIDTGNSTRSAAEMRAKLERAAGGKIKVAAVLLTHWHYADGTAAWLDDGAEVWGHEWLDANRTASTGVSVKAASIRRGRWRSSACCTRPKGRMPSPTGWASPRKSYWPFPATCLRPGCSPTARSKAFTIAGEEVEVAPNRSDTSDSVGFYFPARRTWITNFMVPGVIFNIYTAARRARSATRCRFWRISDGSSEERRGVYWTCMRPR